MTLKTRTLAKLESIFPKEQPSKVTTYRDRGRKMGAGFGKLANPAKASFIGAMPEGTDTEIDIDDCLKREREHGY